MQWHLIQSVVYMCTEIKNKNIPFHVLPYLWLKFLAWLGHCSLNYVLHLYKTYRWMKICHNPWGKKWRNSHESFSHNEGNWKSIVCITNEVSETPLNAQVWLPILRFTVSNTFFVIVQALLVSEIQSYPISYHKFSSYSPLLGSEEQHGNKSRFLPIFSQFLEVII